MPFESMSADGMSPWGFTPEGCTEALVEPYGEYSCATYDYSDDAVQRIQSCNGDCIDGVCVDGYATQEPTVICSLGQAQIGTDCSPCEPGNYNANVGGVCSACPEGTYANEAGSAMCTPCQVGFIAPNAGSQYCEMCKVGYTTDGYGQVDCVLEVTEEPTMEPTVEATSTPACINWFGNNLDWDSMPFESMSADGMSPWGFTPQGCTEALVEPYGEYHCAVYDAAAQRIQSCNGDCFDGVCVDGFATTTTAVIVTEKPSLTPTMDPTMSTTYEPVNCDACLAEFSFSGGCEAIFAGKDATSFIPEGCDPCGSTAEQFCIDEPSNPSSAPTLTQTTDFVSEHPTRSPTSMQTTDFVSIHPTQSPSASTPTLDVTEQGDMNVTYDQTKTTCHNAGQKISQPCNGGRGTGCSFDECTLHCLAESECNFFFHITSRSGCILYRSCDVTRKAFYAGTTVEVVRD